MFEKLSKEANFEEVFIDSMVVRVSQQGAGAPKQPGNSGVG
jgi:hypothetical protein